MSYILEALKKAQAERQLGSSPTIHAPTLQAAANSSQGSRFGKPLIAALVAMGVVIVVLLAMVLRSRSPAATAPAAPSASSAPIAAAAAQLPPSTAVVAPAPAPAQPTPLPAPVADLPPSVANLARASAPEPQAQPAVVASAAAAAAAAAVKAPASEDPVANLRDLPEPIQRAIPQITVGGYIYSKNPADRVLLIDKVLRHEGDEVAPGLVLEKLQAKEAIFGFKGYRYRVPY